MAQRPQKEAAHTSDILYTDYRLVLWWLSEVRMSNTRSQMIWCYLTFSLPPSDPTLPVPIMWTTFRSINTLATSTNPPNKNSFRGHLRPMAETSLLWCNLPSWCFKRVFVKCVSLWLCSFFCYINFRKMELIWDWSLPELESVFPGQRSLIFGWRINYLLSLWGNVCGF